MTTPASDRWVATRALYEGAAPSFEQLAAARAAREGWRDGSLLDAGTQNGRLAKLVDGLIGEIEALGIGNGEGAVGLDKARIEAISTLTRTLEKIWEIIRSDEGTKENDIKRDADMAGLLKRIDERIIELAEGYARQLVCRKPRG
ncbi:hypothetical protein [Mesorhizobium sp. KR1-2]|uniref:hypothetical protein n=1 Tax=Mesorhizobium sp. KR1-2 TaxID=3156609 RepID=UPI0032B5677B